MSGRKRGNPMRTLAEDVTFLDPHFYGFETSFDCKNHGRIKGRRTIGNEQTEVLDGFTSRLVIFLASTPQLPFHTAVQS